MEFIYRRVSTIEQSTDRQLPGLSVDREFEDKLSGKDVNRPQLQALLGTIRAGDVIHVHELSRLGRSVKDLLDIVQTIVDTGATIHFHNENLRFAPDKNDPIQQLMLTLMSAFSQFERDTIRSRQREGIAIAKAAGRYKGKSSRFTEAQFEQIQREFVDCKRKTELAKKWGISRGYLYKIAAKNIESPGQ